MGYYRQLEASFGPFRDEQWMCGCGGGQQGVTVERFRLAENSKRRAQPAGTVLVRIYIYLRILFVTVSGSLATRTISTNRRFRELLFYTTPAAY